MVERIISPRLADIIEAIERIGRVLDDVSLDFLNRTGKSVGWLSAELRSFPKQVAIFQTT